MNNILKIFIGILILSLVSLQAVVAQQADEAQKQLGKKLKTYRTLETLEEKEQFIQELIFKFPPKEVEGVQQYYDIFYSDLAVSWLKNKNIDEYQKYADKVNRKTRLYMQALGVVSSWNKVKENLSLGKEITSKILDKLNSKQKNGKENYNPFTHAYVLDVYAQTYQAVGQQEEALKYYKKAMDKYDEADAIRPEFLHRYVSVLVANDKHSVAMEQLASAIMSNIYTDDSLEKFKELFIKNRGSSEGYSSYLKSLKEVGYQKTATKVNEEKIEKPEVAPVFKLKNLDGKQISLSDMEGKVVVVDFWATWCGPCKASFPGMQKAVNKYANDPEVVFLFVNTWQSEKNKEEVVQKFINESEYDFQVLMDTKDSVVKDYSVHGIPTKFVIGKEGNILFKSVGSSGIDSEVVNKMSAMIEIAKNES